MCGIFGIWHRDGQPIELALLQQATTRLRHRGPDDEGYLLIDTQSGRMATCGGADTDSRIDLPPIETVYGQSFNLGLGFRRLAILDLSPAGHQPMASPDGCLWIVFNGEVYNYLELRAELTGYGYEFQTGADTEVILAAYQQWGADCLSRFNGMWALAIWDWPAQRLFMARDRFGIKPLYYLLHQNTFAFASEIKALVGQAGVIQFEPNDKAIYHYLLNGRVPNPQTGQTFFHHVQSLPPSHRLMIQPEAFDIQQFWTLPEAAGSTNGQVSDIVDQYRDLFIDSVQLRLRSDVPIGTCLSGGIDSSSIVWVINRLKTQQGLAAAQIGQQQKTFSAVYETSGRYNERPYIEQVLQATDVEGNFTIPSGAQLQRDIERLIWHQDEPFRSTSIFAQWCVMNAARERGVTVLLDGQGADEVLAGYHAFLPIFMTELISQGRIWQSLTEAQAIQAHAGLAAGPLLARALKRQAWVYVMGHPWLRRWGESLQQQRAASRKDLSWLNPDFMAQQQPERVDDWQKRIRPPNLASYLKTRVQEFLPELLRYEDRNSMAFGLEGRVPFLDYRLVQFSLERAYPWCIHQGWTKWVLRQAMTGLVLDEIIWRKNKVGFETPEVDWLREWLRAEPNFFSDNTLSRKYLNLDAAQQRIELWLETGGNPQQIWRWMNLELWLRVWRSA